MYEGKVCAEKDTPIWILNELLKLRNLTPTYKLIDEFGLKVEVLAGDDSGTFFFELPRLEATNWDHFQPKVAAPIWRKQSMLLRKLSS